MPREEDPQPQEWLVLLTDNEVRPDGTHVTEEQVPAALGGVDVGAMQVGEGHCYVAISDAANRVVWMREASSVRKVSRCAGQSQS